MASLADFVLARLVEDEADEVMALGVFELLAGEHATHGEGCRRLRLLAEAFGADHPDFEETWRA